MRGKLVAQDENDEPANVLLEKIAQEKAQLIKEKKIKKTKPLPEITDEEKPFDIPDSWEWVRLGKVYNFIDYRGKTPHKISSGVRLITAKNVRMGYIKKEPEEFISNAEYDARSTRGFVRKNDILITTEAPMGLVSLNTFIEPIATAQRLITLQKISKNLNNCFISYYLRSKSFQKNLKIQATGSTVKGIKASKLKQIPILIPPLNEQKRIAAKVEELFELLDIIEESTNNYENLQKELKEKILELGMQGKLVEQDTSDESAAVLYEQIQTEKAELIKEKKIKKTKPLPEISEEEKSFDIPESWEWVRFGEIGIFRNGKTPKKEDISVEEKIPYFKVSDMNTPSNRRYLKFTLNYVSSKYEHQTMPKNTIVFPKNGGAVLTAKKRILSTQSLVDLNTGGITGFNSINVNFLFYLFSNVNILNYVRGSAVPTIDSKKLKNLVVGLPPLNEQKRIATKIEELFNTIDN